MEKKLQTKALQTRASQAKASRDKAKQKKIRKEIEKNQDYQHKSVLVKEVLEYLNPEKNKTYLDVTFGGGGHSKAILDLEPECKVIGFDWDKRALDLNGPRLIMEYGDRIQLIYGSFNNLKSLLKKHKINKVDGILADFGTSQFQISQADGFSFTTDTPLDMRMSNGHYKITAADILSKASEEELTHILFEFGQEREAKKIARAIIQYRSHVAQIKTTKQLCDIIGEIILPFSRKTNPATKTFQALRIVVNDELNNIKSLLQQAPEILKPGGRIVCISFHSLEDRIVKNSFKEKDFVKLTPKVVTASEQELEQNPSARSAKLRAASLADK